MAGELGLDVNLDCAPELGALPADVALFSESNGRFVVTVAESDAAAFATVFRGLACHRIGTVTEARTVRVSVGGARRVELAIDAMKAAYKETLAHV